MLEILETSNRSDYLLTQCKTSLPITLCCSAYFNYCFFGLLMRLNFSSLNCFTLKPLPPLQLPFHLKKGTFVKMLKYLCLLLLWLLSLYIWMCLCIWCACMRVCVFDNVWVHMDMCTYVCVRAEVDVGWFPRSFSILFIEPGSWSWT